MQIWMKLYGCPGNVWTDRVSEAYTQQIAKIHAEGLGVDFCRVAEFDWSRDERGVWRAPYLDDGGRAHIPRQPSILLGAPEFPIEHQYRWLCRGRLWAVGLEDCLGMIKNVKELIDGQKQK